MSELERGNHDLSDTTACATAEQIAALADGGLTGDERQRVMEHVGACERCYELLSETLHLTSDEVESVATSSTRSWTRWMGGGAIAAAALIAAVLLWPAAGTSARDWARRVVEPTGGESIVEGDWSRIDWTVTRSAEDLLDRQQIEVRLGVRLVDLFVAIHAGSFDDAETLARELSRLAGGLQAARTVEEAFDEAAAAFGSAPPDADAGRQAADRGATALEAILPSPTFDMGKTVESIRLLARSGREEELDDPALVDALEELIGADVSDADQELLRGLLAAMEEGGPGRAGRVEAATVSLLVQVGGR